MLPQIPRPEKTRVYSLLGVLALAGTLTALLFQDIDAVRLEIEVPAAVQDAGQVPVRALVHVPAGQRLPVAGATLVVEDVSRGSPFLLDAATCWGDARCTDDLRHAGRRTPIVSELGLAERDAEPSEGPLWVRVEGYGQAPTTGYGAEVEPRRRLTASDIEGEGGRTGYGLGYGGERAALLVYTGIVDTTALEPGRYHVTFLVETGSVAMGPVSSPSTPIMVG